MKLYTFILGALIVASCTTSVKEKQTSNKANEEYNTTIEKENGTHWWAGIIGQGHNMPFNGALEIDTWKDNFGNQVQPLVLSSAGDVLWTDGSIKLSNSENEIVVSSDKSIQFHQKLGSLKEAYLFASNTYFPPSGLMPDSMLFSSPQYNTWIELMYDQNQKDIEKYANAIIENGYPAGVLMIDDNWQEDYGKWNFHEGRFNDPKGMIDRLHQQGFKVMMWVCPFVSADCDVFRDLETKGAFLNHKNGQTAMVKWWNGYSALLDLTKPVAINWFEGQLQKLVDEYGVDGFKLDAGDSKFYAQDIELNGLTPNDHMLAYAKIGLKFSLNEYRANFKMGNQPLANRLHDKDHNWVDLRKLIPQMLVEGISGYPFSCPDMIGGGQFISFLNLDKVDQELIVRSAQCHALMPMMQFSVAPWRILDEKHHSAVKKSVQIREKFKAYILEQASYAATSGEPIMRLMEYNYPNEGYAKIVDQFMIGTKLLVAPVLENNVREREVVLPNGDWIDKDGKKVKGNQTINCSVELDELLFFTKAE
ncbi:MAG: glycoside hydrolase family 31 protein [Carboxylicivirga sp.]|nr:glycoside hydrolase family 31 protein [Carboxylicivirga sp.]